MHPFSRSFIHSLIRSFGHSFIHSLILSFSHSFLYSFIVQLSGSEQLLPLPFLLQKVAQAKAFIFRHLMFYGGRARIDDD